MIKFPINFPDIVKTTRTVSGPEFAGDSLIKLNLSTNRFITSRLILFNMDTYCVQSGKLLVQTVFFFCAVGLVMNTVSSKLEQKGLKYLH